MQFRGQSSSQSSGVNIQVFNAPVNLWCLWVYLQSVTYFEVLMDWRSGYLCTGTDLFYFCLLYSICHFDFYCVLILLFVIWFIAGDLVAVRALISMTVYFWMISHMIGNKMTIRISRCCFVVEIFDFHGSNLYNFLAFLLKWKNDMSYLSFLKEIG